MDNIYTYAAPGRTELGGNHTDHQHGCVLAAAIDLKTTARVQKNGTDRICVRSQGYAPFYVDLRDLSCREADKNTSAALVRGIAAAFQREGAELFGFDMEVSSDVLPGSGLSSSAAFEVLVGTICNDLFLDGRLTPVQIAQIGQYAENVYFGKPCGLMDQLASAVGGLVFVDFEHETPQVQRLDFDFEKLGYGLYIIDSGADHADLTEEYAAITQELQALCNYFGKQWLRQVPEEVFRAALPKLRGTVPDRAILRAIHVYQENKRVMAQRDALLEGRTEDYLALVKESGRSSWMYLQNIFPAGAVQAQPMALTLALCDTLLAGGGAFRVHGGGFAGTVQAYVPLGSEASFVAGMEAVLGKGCCHRLRISPLGGHQVE